MRIQIAAIVALLLLTLPEQGSSQRRWQQDHKGAGRSERLDKFRKMRLIEVLQLNEGESIRFFAKQNAHESKMRELMEDRNAALDEIENQIESGGDPVLLTKMTEKIKSVDGEMFLERERFRDELKHLLSPQQFGKYLVFERTFGRNVREALDEMWRGKPGNHRE